MSMNKALLDCLKEAYTEYGPNMFFANGRELKAYIDDILQPADREPLERTLFALNLIVMNMKSYQRLSELIKEMPKKVSEYEFNLAVNEIAEKTSTSEKYIEEVVQYILLTSGGTVTVKETPQDKWKFSELVQKLIEWLKRLLSVNPMLRKKILLTIGVLASVAIIFVTFYRFDFFGETGKIANLFNR